MVTETELYRRADPVREEEKPIMLRLVAPFALALAATTATAQNAPPRQSQAPAATSTNGTQPFLFDGRMKGDGARREEQVDNRHPNAGAIIVQPKARQPERK
jgi:tRNA A37 threonylcarbamoyladenosine synthetase subunit TsaC/SUA5/YrdC